MAQITADLGQLELEHRQAGLSLKLTSHAQFATSAKDDFELTAMVAALKPYGREYPGLWVRRSNAFRLVIDIQHADDIVLEGEQSPIDVAVTALRSAELWLQLQLRPVSYECSAVSKTESTLAITFVNDENRGSRSTRMLHRIDVDVPFYDVRPPDGVQSVELPAVRLCLSISRLQCEYEQRLSTCLKQESQDPTQHNHTVVRRHGLIDSSWYEPPETDGEALLDGSPLLLGGEDHQEPSFIGSDSESSEDQNLFWAADEPCVQQPPRIRLRAQDPPAPDYSLHQQGKERIDPAGRIRKVEILQLLDAALRLSICDSPRRLSNLIEVTATESFQRLAELAPTLFSPGYMEAVASRAPFLPTLSHALSSVGMHHARNADLRVKCAELARRASMSDGDVEKNKPSGPSAAAQGPFSTRLWQLMQVHFCGAAASKQLRPLHIGVESAGCDTIQPLDFAEEHVDHHIADEILL